MPIEIPTTPTSLVPLIAAGAQMVVRDEEWLVRSSEPTPSPTAGELLKDWSTLWTLCAEWEEAPRADRDLAFWLGDYTAPFPRHDRAVEITRANNDFRARIARIEERSS